MKVAIIVPYFGKLPDYFQLFLDSCEYNQKFNWIIFTDDETKYRYPDNVSRFIMTFDECQQLVRSKFDFEISLSKPQKLCDFKCAYGIIFEEYLKEFDWWGHCDLDQIFGNLSNFITEEMLNKYDKLFSLGHLTLYRNTKDNNIVFMNKFNGKFRYKEVFTTDRGCAFDEWIGENINEIYLQTDRPVLLDCYGADINSYKTTFQTVNFDIKSRSYNFSPVRNSVFEFNNGQLFQIFIRNKSLQKIEFPYVHLQKRKMKDKRKNSDSNHYFIIPNKFIDANIDVKKIIRSCNIWRIINYQYINVKYKSFKYRLNSSDWQFNNVFKK